MKFHVSLCLQLVLAGGLWASVGHEPDPEVLLDEYNTCNKKFENIYYDLETTLQAGSKKYVYSLQYCSNNEKKQWIGDLKCYNEDATIDQMSSSLITKIFNDTMGIYLTHYNPDLKGNLPPRAVIVHSSREKYLQSMDETASHGAPLKGKIDGNNHQSIYDLLKGATILKLYDEIAKMLGYDTYLIEAETKYGIVKAWISPDAGYNCLRWEIVKKQNQFYRDGTTTNDRFTKRTDAFIAEKVEQIYGKYVVTQAKFDNKVENGDTILGDYTYHYNLKKIDLNPDFEALSAFEIKLPEGTIVRDENNPEVRYKWTSGRLVKELAEKPPQSTAEIEVPAAKPKRPQAPEDTELLNTYKNNLTRHIRNLTALESRHVSHPGNARARDYIIDELKKYGYSPVTDSFQARDMTLHNVISDSSDKNKPVILLSAHFDSSSSGNGQAPGADDNASGVAALLELARILKENRIQKNFEFVFFNCEEAGTRGSRHLSDKYRDNRRQIDYMINIDTIGTWKGPLSETCPVNFVTDKNSVGVIEQLQEHFPYPLRQSKTIWRDDHGNFWNNGYKAIEITEDGCTEHMHKPTDTAEKLDYDNIARIVHGLYVFLSR
ncbi:MAG: M20/M25/M40 family metallo-hydrolase [Sedimentisphaerales bacterium]|nr:M20/M25/M40 family metallo-hydrolase [Sedimentisphaerales bacterium]